MRVLFFIESLHASGKERRLAELIKGLNHHPDIDFEIVLTKENIHYKYILDMNIKIHYLVRKYVKKDPTLFYKFYKICKTYKPDIIHVWGNLVAIYAVPAKILLRIPMVNNQISNAYFENPKLKLSTKITFPLSDVIVANSKAGLKAYNAPINKSLCIYNGFDFNRIKNLESPQDIRTKFSIDTTFIVAMIASFVENKDYKTYLVAAQNILENRRDITFLCIGRRNDEKYRNMVEENYKSNILFLGYQKNVEPIINACDIGVLSTFTEGIPNSVVEFMASGKPVVVTDGGGTNELVSNNETGFLIPQKSSDILAAKILKLINDKVLANSMGINGQTRIKKLFNLDNMTKSYVDIYNKLIPTKNRK